MSGDAQLTVALTPEDKERFQKECSRRGFTMTERLRWFVIWDGRWPEMFYRPPEQWSKSGAAGKIEWEEEPEP